MQELENSLKHLGTKNGNEAIYHKLKNEYLKLTQLQRDSKIKDYLKTNILQNERYPENFDAAVSLLLFCWVIQR